MEGERRREEAFLRLQEVMQAEIHLREIREFVTAQELYSQWIHTFAEELSQTRDKEVKEAEWRKQIAVAYNNRGQLKYLGVDFDKAVEDYNTALEYDPHLSSSYYNRGTIYYRMGYYDKAFPDLAKAVELSPETVEFKIGVEQCQKELKTSG